MYDLDDIRSLHRRTRTECQRANSGPLHQPHPSGRPSLVTNAHASTSPATKSTERNRELTQPARNVSNVSPGRSLPVTNRSQAANEPTANAVRSALATFRFPAVSAYRPSDRVPLPTLSASLPCPPPGRVCSRPCPHPYRSITSRAAPPLNVGINRNFIALSTIVQ